MESPLRHEHHRHVPAVQGGAAAHEPGRVDREYGVCERRPAAPDAGPVAATKGAIANFSAGLAQLLGDRGIRVNSVLPGPIWTPLIPATLPPDQVEGFGKSVPLGRAGQPAELAPIYVLLASDEASYMSGGAYPVTGGNPVL